MLTLRLPDGATREVPEGAVPRDVVASIGPRLLRDAIAVQLDGEVVDLNTPLRNGGEFRVLTEKDPESLAVLRHSGAHILATAVRRLRPNAKIGFGPAIEDGFYYDYEVDQPFTPEDLEKFEAEMRKVITEKYPFVREEVSQTEARKRFADDPLKLERLSEFSDDEIISTYTDGPFIDLCRGPHVPDTSYLKHFKLLHTAGAYWRGDEHRQRKTLSDLRAPREFQGEHVRRDGGRGCGLSSEADELSGTHLHLSVESALISGSADTLCGIRNCLSLRAKRCASRNAACAR